MKDEKENMPEVDIVAIVAEVGIWRGLPAVLDFGTRLWRHKNSVVTKHGDIGTTVLYFVSNAGRQYIDFGREGFINNLSF